MKCVNCNSIVPDDSVFCPFCGADLRSHSKTADKPRKRSSSLLIILVIILGLIVIGLVAYIYLMRNQNPANIAEPPSEAISTNPIETLDVPDEKTVEARIADALDKIQRGNYRGLDVMKDLASQGSDLAKSTYDTQMEQLYKAAVDFYHQEEMQKARAIFLHMEGYKDTDKYLMLSAPQDYKAILNIIDFENAKEIIIEKYPYDYLQGLWSTEDNSQTFQLINQAGGSSVLNLSLPSAYASTSFFGFEDGILYLLPEGSNIHYNVTTGQMIEVDAYGNPVPHTNLLRLIPQSADHMQVYCYNDGSIVEMNRIA